MQLPLFGALAAALTERDSRSSNPQHFSKLLVDARGLLTSSTMGQDRVLDWSVLAKDQLIAVSAA